MNEHEHLSTYLINCGLCVHDIVLPDQHEPHQRRRLRQQFLYLKLTHANHTRVVHLQNHVPPLDPPTLVGHAPGLDPHDHNPFHRLCVGIGNNAQAQPRLPLVQLHLVQVSINVGKLLP